ncbi:MAG: hypothetical protein Q7O12_12395 [Deltaproteobacteria bacterium]|nr:hypothetical protein [Deltaproteobacteria bacterium]
MTFTEIFNLIGAFLLSIGGAGAIILALSSWLGKIWANRIMESDRARYAHQLEELRAKLTLENQTTIDNLKHDLELYKEKYLKEHKDKIEIYRLVINTVSDLLADFDVISITQNPPPDTLIKFDKFNRNRMMLYGYLAMLAPQNVMDAYDKLMDHLLQIFHGQNQYVWSEVRSFALSALNEIRKDIGIDKSPIEYRGEL